MVNNNNTIKITHTLPPFLKYVLFGFFALSSFVEANAQHKSTKLDLTALSYKEWTNLGPGTLSNDGRYALYGVTNNADQLTKYTVKDINGNWARTFPSNYNQLLFSKHSDFLFAMHGDTLVQLDLIKKLERTVLNCKSYEIFAHRKAEWLVYQLANNTLIAQQAGTDVKYSFPNVSEYFFNVESQAIILKSSEGDNICSLKWVDLKDGKKKIIYNGPQVSNLIYNTWGDAVAFTTKGHDIVSIWYYSKKYQFAELLITDNSEGIKKGSVITTDVFWRFVTNGSRLCFTQQARELEKAKSPVMPIIWSYQDRMMVPEYQLRGYSVLHRGENFSILNIMDKKIEMVLPENEKVLPQSLSSGNASLLMIETEVLDKELIQDIEIQPKPPYLYVINSGKKIIPDKNFNNFRCFSPANEYAIYYDYSKGSLISYNIATGAIQHFKADYIDEFHWMATIGWVDDQHLLICGKYNVWDINAKRLSVSKNITQSINPRRDIIFTLAAQLEQSKYISTDDIILTGFNTTSKRSVLSSLNIKHNVLKELYRSDFYLSGPREDLPFFQRAKNKNRYLIRLGNVSESPNYYTTTDFKKLDKLTNYEPQNKYNWISSKLVKYKNKEGFECEGILYKPTDFDAMKKYPIIFEYYLEESDEVYKYISPEPSEIGVNIPLLISNGYVVMKPNMYPLSNQAGKGALNSILAAVKYLTQYSWADTAKMAITGHSQGGFESNYIITHCNKFKAAYSGAGVVNAIENYSELTTDGTGRQDYFFSHYKMQDKMENIPEAYVENSPILFTKNIKTPLLLLHNDEDNRVEVNQGKQFFNQLRYQRSPVWLLQYKGEGHFLNNEQNQLDLQERVMGFFNHYLKGEPMPQWMFDHH